MRRRSKRRRILERRGREKRDQMSIAKMREMQGQIGRVSESVGPGGKLRHLDTLQTRTVGRGGSAGGATKTSRGSTLFFPRPKEKKKEVVVESGRDPAEQNEAERRLQGPAAACVPPAGIGSRKLMDPILSPQWVPRQINPPGGPQGQRPGTNELCDEGKSASVPGVWDAAGCLPGGFGMRQKSRILPVGSVARRAIHSRVMGT
ncbi:hypothetical protein EDB81DRAFT_153354 [Dactylonectria macrodidyma]|uniref:Uncharacterized protein n=1 Tax=Dactylonectria macrodidyma TaxID=307937 RepID=A0A9P9JGC2_9HYPO|nr:hypothetical protein EDB81DRAFT_153354 [Dactylonectria macrodidyma]